MGYAAHFRQEPITIDPPLNGKAINEWHADHGVGGHDQNRSHYCAIVLDVTTEELEQEHGDILFKRRAASFHIIDGDDMREDATILDVEELIGHADEYGSRVHGTLVQTDGHPDMTYPVRWVVGHGEVEAQRPVLLYPDDPDAISALAVTVQEHTGEKHGRSAGGIAESNEWGSAEANSVATDMIRDLYTALEKRDDG
jgi:hypothetical protein